MRVEMEVMVGSRWGPRKRRVFIKDNGRAEDAFEQLARSLDDAATDAQAARGE